MPRGRNCGLYILTLNCQRAHKGSGKKICGDGGDGAMRVRSASIAAASLLWLGTMMYGTAVTPAGSVGAAAGSGIKVPTRAELDAIDDYLEHHARTSGASSKEQSK
jgi:hypothetical protein